MPNNLGDRFLTISNLITQFNVLLGINNNFLLAVDSDDLRGAIRIAGMIDQATKTDIRPVPKKKSGGLP